MKKFLALIMVVLMVFALGACQQQSKTADMTAEERALAEAEIRYALGLILDRSYIVEEISKTDETPASSFVSMGMSDYEGEFYKNAGNNSDFFGYYDVDTDAFEENFAKAIEILKKYYEFDESTKKFTNFPTITYLYNTADNHEKIALYIQGAFKEIGITLDIENQEWSTFLNTRKQGDFTMARNGWIADYTDPICFLDMWVSNSGNNDVQFGKGDHANLAIYNLDLTKFGIDYKVENTTWAKTYDVLISEIKKCTDYETKYEMMHLAEDMIMATGCITPLFYYTDPYMISTSVEGFYSNPLGYKYFQGTTVNGKGSSLPVCLASEPDSLDPALNSALDGATMLAHLFSGLAKWAPAEDGSLEIVADCATDLPEGVVNADGSVTYTYTLKDGLKWSDGKALTAKDFEFAWKRAADPATGADYGYMYEVVKGYGTDELAVKALDDKTLEVTLANAITYWNELLAFPTYFPVREDVVKNEAWATDPSTYVGNGPYKMTGWKHDAIITLTKNENYHDKASVTMNEIVFHLSDDANNQLTNFKNGTWLLVDEVPVEEVPTLRKNYAKEFKVTRQLGTYYVCWNINESLLPE